MSSLFCCPMALTWLYVGTEIWTQVRTLAKRALPRTEPPLLCTLNHLQRLANTKSTLQNSYTALLETGKKVTCAHSVPVQLFATTLLCIWTRLAPQIQDACTQRADLYNPSTERLRGGKKPRFWEMVWVSPRVVVLFLAAFTPDLEIDKELVIHCALQPCFTSDSEAGSPTWTPDLLIWLAHSPSLAPEHWNYRWSPHLGGKCFCPMSHLSCPPSRKFLK